MKGCSSRDDIPFHYSRLTLFCNREVDVFGHPFEICVLI